MKDWAEWEAYLGNITLCTQTTRLLLQTLENSKLNRLVEIALVSNFLWHSRYASELRCLRFDRVKIQETWKESTSNEIESLHHESFLNSRTPVKREEELHES